MTSGTTTSSLTLSATEAAVLASVLNGALEALRDEVHKTDSFDMRQELKQRETILVGIVGQLKP